MQKYYIIPVSDTAPYMFAWNKEEALDLFEELVDIKHGFKAVTEEEYISFLQDRSRKLEKKAHIDFFTGELMSSFGYEKAEAETIAERAEEIYSGKEGEGLTEYEALEKAVDEFKKK